MTLSSNTNLTEWSAVRTLQIDRLSQHWHMRLYSESLGDEPSQGFLAAGFAVGYVLDTKAKKAAKVI